ncbi:hypothetical protein [Terasakiella pusilla]|uniref:hypothetical protein n=1 Tax=Terasakiella pusilla TaxID=64973 RepID=UPI003AA82FC5
MMAEHTKIWLAAKDGGYRVKMFHVPEGHVETYCRAIAIKHPRSHRSKVWCKYLTKHLRNKMMAGEMNYYGVPVRVTPSFETIVTNTLATNSDSLIDLNVTQAANDHAKRMAEDEGYAEKVREGERIVDWLGAAQREVNAEVRTFAKRLWG